MIDPEDQDEIKNLLATTPTTGLRVIDRGMPSLEGREELARKLANCSLIPATWAGKAADIMVLLDISQRMGVSPGYLFQNTYPVNGRLGWFTGAMAALASTSRSWLVEPDWRTVTGAGGVLLYVDCAAVLRDGRPVYARVSLAEAVEFGWVKTSSKPWTAAPEQMLRWRSLARLLKLYAPNIASFGSPIEDLPEDQVAALINGGNLLFTTAPVASEPIGKIIETTDGRRVEVTYLPPDTQALVAARSPTYIVFDAQIRQQLPGWSLWKFDMRLSELGLTPLSLRPPPAFGQFMQAFALGNAPPGFFPERK